MPVSRGRQLAGVFGACALCLAWPIAAAAQAETPDLSRLSLEELAEVKVTSVSRRAEQVAHAPSSVFVITADDIRRSGAASLPEVLRLAPNLQVQQVNAVDYAITARGFNGFETANKLLVLIDGRSLYEPLHAGIFWDAHDVMLHDIERIEVISGPGGALHGANAVNGVINIITRSAAQTRAAYAEASAGDEAQVLALRHGGDLGEIGAWRAYVQGVRRDDTLSFGEELNGLRVGFRSDMEPGASRVTVQGDGFSNDAPLGYQVKGGNLLARWSRPLDAGGGLELQAYYDLVRRSSGAELEREEVADFQFQHDLLRRGDHQLIWGGGYRHTDSLFRPLPGATSFLAPARRDITLASLFVQDQVSVSEDVTLTLGLKFEDSSLSGDEFMPSARLAWRSPGGALVWGAVSRAARTATRIERDLTSPGVLVGGNFESEHVTAYELGYRANFGGATLSVSAYYNDYADLRTAEPVSGVTLPLHLANAGEGRSFGLEAWGDYDVTPRWRLSLGVAAIEKSFAVKPGSVDVTGLASTGDDPQYQVLLRSSADIGERGELDVRLRAVDELDVSGTESYVEADVRFGWRLRPNVELSVAGTNLFDGQRLETAYPRRHAPVGRNVLATLRVGY